jgi:membrane associated rhomboid family serine protease
MSITLIIISITALVSFNCFSNRSLFDKLKFNAYAVAQQKQWYRLFSHALVHGDWMHLGVNMFVLWSFGSSVERYFTAYFGFKGTVLFIILYLGGVAFASVSALIKHKDNYYYNSVGASGAVGAVLFASILLNPMSSIYLFFIPIGIPAFIFGPMYIAYEVYMAKRYNDNIAHDAHYWGAVFGFILPILFEPKLFVVFLEQIF